MRRFPKFVLAILLAVMFLAMQAVAVSAEALKPAPSSEPVSDPSNDYLAIQVGSDGRFNSGATGVATGRSFNIIYYWPYGPDTSFTTIRIDGVDYVYGSSGSCLEAPTEKAGLLNESIWQIGDIKVTQSLQIVTGSSTGRADTGMYKYTVTNTGAVSHTVGVRIMLDTMLNSNDGAPFRVPGVGDVTTERDFTGSAVPQYWQAFYSLSDPNIMAQGTLIGGGATTPDRLVLCNWGNIYGTNWGFTPNSGVAVTSDSAMAVYWNPVTLAPGQSRDFATFYGLGTVSGSASLSVTGPAVLGTVNNVWSPNPFTVTAYVGNTTGGTLTNVQVTLSLPAGLGFAGGEAATHTIATVPNNGTGQTSWSVLATSAGTWTYTVTSQGQTAQRSVEVPVLITDTIAPTTTASQAPAPNGLGWNNSDVAVTLTATDNEGGLGVKEIRYTLNGGAEQAITGSSASVGITAEGSTVLRYWAVDNANNVEAQKQLTAKIDRVAPIGSHLVTPAPVAQGWNNTSATIYVGSSDVGGSGVHHVLVTLNGSSFTANGSGFNSTIPMSGVFNYTYCPVDNVGNVGQVYSASVKIDKNAPALVGVRTPAANTSGWNNTDVTVHFDYSDALSGVAGTIPDTVLSGEGVGQSVTQSISDVVGNMATTTVDNINIDKTAPITIATADRPANSNGWYMGGATLTLSATDKTGGAGVKDIHYVINRGGEVVFEGDNVVIDLPNEGAYEVEFWATDKAGNTEAADTAIIAIDLTKPEITGSRTPSANGSGWNNGPVTVHFSYSDALSGIVGNIPDTVLANEGAGQPVTRSISDKAGNVAEATVGGINIDLTKPGTTYVVTPEPLNGWNDRPATLEFTATDEGGSGVNQVWYKVGNGSPVSTEGATASVTISTEGTTIVTYWTTDRAGNVEEARTVTVRVDVTAPTIVSTQAPEANQYGWNRGTVDVNIKATDNQSGCGVKEVHYTVNGEEFVVSDAEVELTFPGEGDYDISYFAIDNVGNVGETGNRMARVDLTYPEITGHREPTANTYGWNNEDVTVFFEYSDLPSGILEPIEEVVVSGEGADQSVTRSVSDLAGNVSSFTVDGISIDKTDPVTTATPDRAANSYGWYMDGVTLTLSATDKAGGAGVKDIHYVIDGGDEVVFEGNSVDINLPDEGVYEVEFWATDKSDNVEVAKTTTIRIDLTLPEIEGSRTPPANEYGWNNENVTVHFDYSDALSGIVGSIPDTVLSGEGEGQSVERSIRDEAGNVNSDIVTDIHIDKTRPTLSIESPNVGPYLTSESFEVTYVADDGLSGIASEVADLNGVPVVNGKVIDLAELAGKNTLTVTITDKADNVTTKSVTFTVIVDATVNIDPNTLNLKSNGGSNSITVYVEFPEEYNAADIDVSTVTLEVNGVEINAALDPTSVEDRDGDGLPERMVKVDRQAVEDALAGVTGDTPMTVRGEFSGRRTFQGADVMRVTAPGNESKPGKK